MRDPLDTSGGLHRDPTDGPRVEEAIRCERPCVPDGKQHADPKPRLWLLSRQADTSVVGPWAFEAAQLLTDMGHLTDQNPVRLVR